MDDAGVRGVRADVAGDPVVEAHADGEQQVGRLDGPVDVLPAVHAHEPVGERVPLVQGADPEQGPRDRRVDLLGECLQLRLGAGVEHTVAGQDHRPLGGGKLRGGELELLVVALHRRPEAGQARDDLVLGRVDGLGRLLQGVLGDVDVDGAGPAAAGDVERLGDHPRQLVGVADQVVVLGHRQRDAVDVDLLERVLADERRGHVAGDRDHRDGVEHRRADAGDEVGRAGAGCAHAHADLAGGARVAVGGVGAALLVADEDVAQLGVVAEDVVQGQDHAARVAEHDVDALAEQRFADHVGADPRARPVLGRADGDGRRALVEHLALGALDGGSVLGPGRGDVAPARTVALGQGHDSLPRLVTLPPSPLPARKTQNPRLSAGVRLVLGFGDR